ncbi:cytochrome b/b6 domain-containing protein [Roseomonas sp. OT10]|uniref:cytochrome b n=1 Tax=Roseomonas cutis TaxID=2897332 RepID=UPI001E2C6395|nr:cytochrome b/b6 domain-containing protein [Roseomonas sp. OT10]UFN50622.1 cytochrome b/b6 domain-containing protein [Roseomonas sp. OT10]
MRYTATARLLHWLTVALLLILGSLGLWITRAEPADEEFKLKLYNIHESIGIAVFVLTVMRLAWRVAHPPPPLPADLAAVLRLAAHMTHAALYALLLTMPVVGFLATNAWGFPLTWFGLVPIPSPIGRDETWAPILSAAHGWMALALAGLVALHAGAALWHHLVRRDDTLRRMLPG